MILTERYASSVKAVETLDFGLMLLLKLCENNQKHRMPSDHSFFVIFYLLKDCIVPPNGRICPVSLTKTEQNNEC